MAVEDLPEELSAESIVRCLFVFQLSAVFQEDSEFRGQPSTQLIRCDLPLQLTDRSKAFTPRFESRGRRTGGLSELLILSSLLLLLQMSGRTPPRKVLR